MELNENQRAISMVLDGIDSTLTVDLTKAGDPVMMGILMATLHPEWAQKLSYLFWNGLKEVPDNNGGHFGDKSIKVANRVYTMTKVAWETFEAFRDGTNKEDAIASIIERYGEEV